MPESPIAQAKQMLIDFETETLCREIQTRSALLLESMRSVLSELNHAVTTVSQPNLRELPLSKRTVAELHERLEDIVGPMEQLQRALMSFNEPRRSES